MEKENNYEDFRGTEILQNKEDVLEFIPSYYQFETVRQVVDVLKCIDSVAFVAYQRDREGRNHLTHFWFTPDEVEMIINKLKEFTDGA